MSQPAGKRFSALVLCLALFCSVPKINRQYFLVEGKKTPTRPSSGSSTRGSTRAGGVSGGSSRSGRRTPPTSSRRAYQVDIDEYDEEDFENGDFMDEAAEDDEDIFDDEEILRPLERGRAKGSGRKKVVPLRGPGRSRAQSQVGLGYDDDELEFEAEDSDEYASEPRMSSSRRSGTPSASRGRKGVASTYATPSTRRGIGRRAAASRRGPPSRNEVVPYGVRAAGTFTKGLAALRESLPAPSAVKNTAATAFLASRQTTMTFSRGIYREMKGFTSSELEQVMLKATRPDDSPVKGKHVERLVGVTYQISPRYDIYDAVLRKLWKKMVEGDWRTKIKAVYILHRFSTDGSPDHQPALKARLRELRRTKDPKRKEKYFNSKQLLGGNASPENVMFRQFLARYAHYVLLRSQCFGGMFMEIAPEQLDTSSARSEKKSKDSPQKPITATSLRSEHLEAAKMLLKAGCACELKDGEECENTALAVERVVSDMMGLTSAVALALTRALKGKESGDADPTILKRWCEFYSAELLPQTRVLVKRTSPRLDAYGLFLPSRMGATLSHELLQKGLKGEAQLTTVAEGDEEVVGVDAEGEGAIAEFSKKEDGNERENTGGLVVGEEPDRKAINAGIKQEAPVLEGEYDEYEYEEEYYDDE